MTGAALGSVIPVVGTGVGAIVGGVVGGVGGSLVGHGLYDDYLSHELRALVLGKDSVIRTINKKRRWLQQTAGLTLLTVMTCSVWPTLLIPFVKVLPYLQPYSLATRMAFFALMLAASVAFMLTTGFEKLRSTFGKLGWKDLLGGTAGIVMFAAAGAWLSASTQGTLVKLFPSDPYEGIFEVTRSEPRGRRNPALELELKAKENGGVYTLTLSKRLFDYPLISSGDVLQLKGEENFFGVYISSGTVVRSSRLTAPPGARF